MNSDIKFVLLTAVGTAIGVLILQHLQNHMTAAKAKSATATSTTATS
jgi:hypothetical protein